MAALLDDLLARSQAGASESTASILVSLGGEKSKPLIASFSQSSQGSQQCLKAKSGMNNDSMSCLRGLPPANVILDTGRPHSQPWCSYGSRPDTACQTSTRTWCYLICIYAWCWLSMQPSIACPISNYTWRYLKWIYDWCGLSTLSSDASSTPNHTWRYTKRIRAWWCMMAHLMPLEHQQWLMGVPAPTNRTIPTPPWRFHERSPFLPVHVRIHPLTTRNTQSPVSYHQSQS